MITLTTAQPAAPPGGTDILSLGGARLNWLQSRQTVLAGNIANANTPGYVARDISPFTAALAPFSIRPAVTQPGHIGAPTSAPVASEVESEHAIDGNQISLDQQLEQVASVNDQQHFAVNLYGSYMTMFQTVLGK